MRRLLLSPCATPAPLEQPKPEATLQSHWWPVILVSMGSCCAWADPKHPPHSPRAPTVPPLGARGRGHRCLPFVVPKARQPELLLDRPSTSGHSARREIYPPEHHTNCTDFSTTPLPVDIPPMQLQQSPGRSAARSCTLHRWTAIAKKKAFCSPGCCRAHHTLTLPSDQAFAKQQQKRKRSVETPEGA